MGYTSPKVKNKWNKEHYDSITFMCKKGGKEQIKIMANNSGQSMAAYLINLVCKDAQEKGKQAVVDALRGGG